MRQIILVLLCGAIGFFGHIESTAAQPYNEDEWYHPSDWFDDDNYEYDNALGLDTTFAEDPAERTEEEYSSGEVEYEYDSSKPGRHYTPTYTSVTTRNGWPAKEESEGAGWRSGRREILGEVQNWEILKLTDRRGSAANHTVMELKLQDGRSVLVDLGRHPAKALQQVSRGDRIVVVGRPGRINERNVLMAERLSLNGETFDLPRPPGIRTGAGAEGMTLRGEVETVRFVEGPGTRDRRTHVKLRLANGRSATVDLGHTSPSQLDLDRADQVTIRGERTEVNGTPVLQARELWINGRQAQLQQGSQRAH